MNYKLKAITSADSASGRLVLVTSWGEPKVNKSYDVTKSTKKEVGGLGCSREAR